MSVSSFVKRLPLAHSVAGDMVPKHAPGEHLVVIDRDSFVAGVAFYLGPLRRWYQLEARMPVLGYLFHPDIEKDDWIAFPCDVGRFQYQLKDSNPAADLSSVIGALTLRDRSWRSHTEGLIERGFGGDVERYLSSSDRPEAGSLPAEVELHASNDPITWTPEVRSPQPIDINAKTVARAFLFYPAKTADAKFSDEQRQALMRTESSLKSRGIGIEHIAKFPRESATAALARESSAWIRKST